MNGPRMHGPRGVTRRAVEVEFDRKARAYEEGRVGGWYKAHAEIILGELTGVHGPVLDVGCGTAWLLRNLVRRDPSLVGVGVDISGEMVRVGQERGASVGTPLHLIHGDWEDLAVRSDAREALRGPANAVVCANALHYFRDPESALRSFRDALAPGGRLLIFERALDRSPSTALWHFFHRFVIRDGVRFYDVSGLRTMLERAGFTDVRVVRRVRRLLWKGKLVSSVVLLSARRPIGPRPEVS
jgi:SAM-dependent methyltransferase